MCFGKSVCVLSCHVLEFETEVLTFWPFWSDLLSLSLLSVYEGRQSVTPEYWLACLTWEAETTVCSVVGVSACHGSRLNTII
jgi:hypothetical protein